MNISLKKVLWIVVCGILVLSTVTALFQLRWEKSVQQEVADARRVLREQGFKTDLADFNFMVAPAMSLRASALTAVEMARGNGSFYNHPNLMEMTPTGSVVIVWQQTSLKRENSRGPDDSDVLTWDEFRATVNANQMMIDEACDAVLSGPFGFDLQAGKGGAILLPHLAAMKNLTQTLGSRTMLEIHDGDLDAAWTNLMAATRLVSAWNAEPAEVSQLVRHADATLAFNSLWQALQTNGWSDDQLSRLQHEWESIDFFKSLPETTAFKRACAVADCQRERERTLLDGESFSEFIKELWERPGDAVAFLKGYKQHWQYTHYGSYQDEKKFLLFYRDREVELRNAIRAPTWLAMRQLPGVTNNNFFQTTNRSALQSRINLRELNSGFMRGRASLLARAAEAEAKRRILIVALALERFHKKSGMYPPTLDSIAPEFLPAVPLDFIDGQPLRYRLNPDGHFLLYSLGLDGVDDGGKMLSRKQRLQALREAGPVAAAPDADILWPLPASAADAQELRRQEARASELQNRRELERESEQDWEKSPARQARVAKILATTWSPALDAGFFGGRPAADFLRNPNTTSNSVSLAELLTPRQVITGHEPEDLTFEFPINFDALGDHGFLLQLDADMDPQSLFAPDCGASIQERNRAANGDCLLTWHTIFDPPGDHALQVELTWTNPRGGETWCRGPAISVTTTNLCQFSLDSSSYDIEEGATFHARLPEANGLYSIECVTTNGAHLATLTGSTSNGEFNVVWNLTDNHGDRLHGETFNSIVHLTLPDSGRTQTLRGP